jgi:hypothetical protein
MNDDVLTIAHRVWAEPQAPIGSRRKSRAKSRPQGTKESSRGARKRTDRRSEPAYVLFFDTETTIDYRQNLTFGCWRYCRTDPEGLTCIDEGLFYQDDLEATDPEGLEVLRRFIDQHSANTERDRKIRLMSRSEFVERVFYKAGYEARARIVGFNLPFDLARLAVGVKEGRKQNFGGFSLILWPGKEGSGYEERRHRPRINVKSLDSKGAFISYSTALGTEAVDQIPDDSTDGLPDERYGWRGRFLDVATLVFALTGTTYTLDGACRAFGVEGKAESGEHGHITDDYVEYCRQDVRATQELYEALMAEFHLHPINLAPEKAFSPASLSKAYLAAMGIEPLLERHPNFSRDVLGYAMSGFFGGRAECRARNVPLPVALVDFTSMYPLVDTLMDLHRIQIARRIEVVDATQEVRDLLDSVTVANCLDPQLWPQFVGFARVRPQGDILPVRGLFNGKTFNISVTPLTSDEPLWYSIADCVAAKLLTGKAPEVVEAIRLEGKGNNSRLTTAKVRGTLEVDPSLTDPMTAMTEERQRVKRDTSLDSLERDRLALALKIVINAGSYGIYSEFNARERRAGEEVPVRVHGRGESFYDRVPAAEDPGRYCFPPFASCITGAARLMLSILERLVTDLGGTWVFCDTDSMAILATEQGGLVACPGGPRRLPDGTEAVLALSYEQVESIRETINALNPFECDAVPHVLKLEAKAFCLAISVKRYALYHLDERDRPVFLNDHPPSENGLGHFLNPANPGSHSKEWTKDVWRIIIGHAHGHEAERPAWMTRPTMAKTAISSTPVQRAFRHLNAKRSYGEQVKPFNFVLTATGARPPAGAPLSASFRLVAPFEADARRWEELSWVDVHDPEARLYGITTRDGRPGLARIDSFEDVLAQYETHPESKALGPDGCPCGRLTKGLLQRRGVVAGHIALIGKEANRLEERVSGELTVDDLSQRLTIYHDDDLWERSILPWLKTLGTRVVAETTGVSERRVRDWLTGQSLPHPGMRLRLRHWLDTNKWDF